MMHAGTPRPAIVPCRVVQGTTSYRNRTLSLLPGGPDPTARVFFAPGRANLLGAHLDYNGGCVMPVALSRGTYAAFRTTNTGLLRLRSENFPQEPVNVPLGELRPGRTDGWSAYVEGAIYSACKQWGSLSGLDVALVADLPMSRGLSSSASVESVVVFALSHLLQAETHPDEMIRLAHEAETLYVGVRCGILDQAAILLAKENSLLYLDCLELTREHLPLDADHALIATVDSGVPRNLQSSAFNERVAQCTQALSTLQQSLPGITCLRDVSEAQFEAERAQLSETLQRRVLHVVQEVRRTETAAEALRKNDLHGFGRALNDAHVSLRDLYEVSIPELDDLVEGAQRVQACYGSRLTGAGFGGCTVAIVHPEGKEEFSRRVPEYYFQKTGRTTEVQWFEPAGGPRELIP